jgi:hypothetical protein
VVCSTDDPLATEWWSDQSKCKRPQQKNKKIIDKSPTDQCWQINDFFINACGK